MTLGHLASYCCPVLQGSVSNSDSPVLLSSSYLISPKSTSPGLDSLTMSNLAQEEVDRYLSNTSDHLNCHPEDISRSGSDSESDNDRTTTHTAVQSDPDDDEETLHSMATMATTRTAYHLPSTLFDANTGPKGVIADAHSFERAKKKSFRRTLIDLTNGAYNTITLGSKLQNTLPPQKENLSSSPSSSGGSDAEDEEEFMRQWRQKRIQEMNAGAVRRQSPSKRKYGSLDAVDAEGFLDAVEKVPNETVVVVCIYDPEVCLIQCYLSIALRILFISPPA